jgi:hypothetical protein
MSRPLPRCTPTERYIARPRSASRAWARLASAAISARTSGQESIECWFGEPIVSGGRAAVEWWGSWTEQDQELTYAGVSVLRFDDRGQVVEHRDYDNHVEQRQPPYADW